MSLACFVPLASATIRIAAYCEHAQTRCGVTMTGSENRCNTDLVYEPRYDRPVMGMCQQIDGEQVLVGVVIYDPRVCTADDCFGVNVVRGAWECGGMSDYLYAVFIERPGRDVFLPADCEPLPIQAAVAPVRVATFCEHGPEACGTALLGHEFNCREEVFEPSASRPIVAQCIEKAGEHVITGISVYEPGVFCGGYFCTGEALRLDTWACEGLDGWMHDAYVDTTSSGIPALPASCNLN